jgi:choloylglycine hydrolase
MKRSKTRKCASCCLLVCSVLTAAIISLPTIQHADACTGITLVAKDGAVVFGRTQEWGTFDLRSRVAIIPRG